MTLRGPPLVLHVIHHLVIGGMENGLVNLINRMPASRFRHAIACIEDYSDFRSRLTRDDVEVIPLYRSKVGVWAVRRELFRLCRRLRPAIVHSRGMSGLDALLPTRLAGTRHHVHGEHGWDVHDLDGTASKPALLRRIHSPLIDRYVTVSKHLERYLVERVRVAPSRITQIYNGVDTERFTPLPRKPSGVLPAHFADPDSIVIGTVGRLQLVKDHATLVKAFAALTRLPLGERLRLVIVGGGPLLGELQRLVAELGVAGQTWLPGPLSDVPSVMRWCDVFVLSSLSEGISNTILEAMACGLPIVATRVGGNVELVDEGRMGELFEPGDVAALAGLLERYAADPAWRGAHAALARQRAVEVFGLQAMVDRYQAVYEGFGQAGRWTAGS
jgi:sugar transferase (PEP-CTERM/EpsH1 system associated)